MKLPRRQALAGAAGLLGLSMAPPRALAVTELPDATLLKQDPETYWKRIRKEQFFLPEWRHFLNNGSLGVMPKPVFAAVADFLETGASLTSDVYPRWGYEPLDEHRTALSQFIGCKKDELAITHSATSSMSIVAAGLDLKAGDEVLITDQEHPSGRGCWQLQAARHGVTLREVTIPQTPRNKGELLDRITSAIGPRTKVLSFSGVTTTTGLILPSKEICSYARSKGVITVLDGAHMHGQIPVNIADIGCDFMAGSPHKWLFAPAGSGLLYIREEWLDRLWPTIVTGGWDEKKNKAVRFMSIGTNNRAIPEGMVAGLRFGHSIGFENIYRRNHDLAKRMIAKARQMPVIEVVTPDDDAMFGSLVSLRFKKDPAPMAALCRKRRIWITGGNPLRMSVHIHTRPEDLDAFFDTVRETLA
jgi:selenocysteine lyase/cysteine desulfurase